MVQLEGCSSILGGQLILDDLVHDMTSGPNGHGPTQAPLSL